MMAVTWAGVGVRWYKAPSAHGEAVPGGEINPTAPSASTASGTPKTKSSSPEAAKGALLFPVRGTLTPFLQINLSPDDVSGIVIEINFKEGDRVEKGQVLARIRDQRYRNDYDAAKGALASAQCKLLEMLPESVRKHEIDQAQADLEEAEATRLRAQQQIDRINAQKGVISKQDVEQAEADLKAAIAKVVKMDKAKILLIEGPRRERIKGAEADVVNAKAKLDECDRLLKNCTVVSPIDGTILTKAADKGVLVSPMSFNVASGICTIADLSDLESEIEVREDQITQIKTGLRCEVVATADPTRVYKGRIDRIMPIADDTKNIIKVRVKVQLPEGEIPGSFLKPKMSTTVRVYNEEIPSFDEIPPPREVPAPAGTGKTADSGKK
jgi:multidrug efflux pump subunit AcrA (membrane-fusion protein)